METETETVVVNYYVDVEIDGQSGTTRFGPVNAKDKADTLLMTLAARANVTKATRVKELEV